MQATESPVLGQTAPEFTLKGPGGQPVSLSDYRGKQNVLLVFYPLAFSPVCSHQLPEVQKALADFEALDTVVLGISVDSHYANTAFARHLRLHFPLLSDFEHAASIAYGVMIPQKRYSGRALFVVDKSGALIHVDVAPDVDQIPSTDKALASLRAQG
jgi:peroxiredoxin